MKTEFSKYLSNFMADKGYKLEYISQATGASVSAIGHYKTGERIPKDDFIEKFISAFILDNKESEKVRYLISRDRTPRPIIEKIEDLERKLEDSKNIKNQSNISISKFKAGSTEMIQVPVYNSVSAGSGLEPSPEPVDVLLLPKSVAEGCVIINVWGDSMEPTIKDGYAVMVKREIEVANNDIGIFIHEGEALVKRYKCFDGKCYLYSDNQNYPPREIRKNDEFKVCGKVIWIMEKA